MRALALPAALAATALLASACDNPRSAESESPTAEAEVETTLPEEIVSDAELQAAADQAAAAAGSATVPADPAAGAAGGVQTTPGADAGATPPGGQSPY